MLRSRGRRGPALEFRDQLQLGIDDGFTGDPQIDNGSGLDLEDAPSAGTTGVDFQPDLSVDGDDDASDFGEASDFSTLADEVRPEERQEAADAVPAQPVGQAPAEVTIENVGEPEDWDFFSDESLEPPMEPIDHAMGRAMAVIEVDAMPQAAGPELAPSYTRSRPKLGGLHSAGRMLGWLVTVALCAFGIARGVFHVAPPSGQKTPAVDLGDIQAEEIRATWLDTARSAQLYAVHGRLVNVGARALLAGSGTQVALLSTQGERLEIPAARAGLPLGEEQLRELSPEALAEAATASAVQLAGTRLEPGQAVDFQALFDSVPDEATSFLVEMTEPAPMAPALVPEPALEDARTTPSSAADPESTAAAPEAPGAAPNPQDPTNLP